MRIVVKDADFSAVSVGKVSVGPVEYNYTDIMASDPTYSCTFATGTSYIGSNIDLTPSTSTAKNPTNAFTCAKIEVKAGDSVYLKCIGGNGIRAWGKTQYYQADPSKATLLAVCDVNESSISDCSEGVTITIEHDGWLLIVNNENRFPNEDVVIRVTEA